MACPVRLQEDVDFPVDLVPPCGRCKGSGIDPEDSSSGSVWSDFPEPPALEPCRHCQFPPPAVRPDEYDRWHPVGARLCLVPYGEVCPHHH